MSGLATDDTGTYDITGIPVIQDYQYKTKNIPYAPGIPYRRNLADLYPSFEPELQRQWTLFVLALERFKALPVDQKLSYFRIAGIHGYPETDWDGADPPPHEKPDPKPGDNPYGGYCQHNTITFPTWHRPYLLLFEKRIWEHMKEIIKEWDLDEERADLWNTSADSWRLPYWDWAQKQTYNNRFSLPFACITETVYIFLPHGPAAHPNPLWGFVNPEKGDDGKPLKMGEMPAGKEKWNINDGISKDEPKLPWSQCTGVSRYGIRTSDGGKTYEGLEGRNNFESANNSLASFSTKAYNPYPKGTWEHDHWVAPGDLADAVGRLLSPEYNNTWGTFASTKWVAEGAEKRPTRYMSLEYIHNNIHNLAGGTDMVGSGLGHLSEVSVSAFDPLFWLHHCNVDRLLAIWQSLNWDLWWDRKEPDGNGQNVEDPTETDPLKPFHNKENGDPKADFWTSKDARDWTKLWYQYDDLAPKASALEEDGTLNEREYIHDLRDHIRDIYPSTPQYISTLYDSIKRNHKNFLGPKTPGDGNWNDYIVNIDYDRYALEGRSYSIELWLGGEPNDPASAFAEARNMVGHVYVFGGLNPAAPGSAGGCANCGLQREQRVLSRGQVPLTIPLILQALDKKYKYITSLDQEEVYEYLFNHLHWRFIQAGGTEKPADRFPKTFISVWAGEGIPERHRERLVGAPGAGPEKPARQYHRYKESYSSKQIRNWIPRSD
ncbi:common central domain of tyrosinase-domain-containing protein [Durotheca rogersii]|uniref:common central domain of tyrosinase-domain-containing protein n=1 Tax=Durotheca rogersii TaxID=419775 RepID=UPI00221ECE49|nr:common central domain of tyrosinase-domain-containing protein [Durotheca rogersii]KAI5862472.1 common central domain of tyrosinase-domain-containing protein [Durotheca rogersii]